jgi:hypothetical protein
MGPRAEKKREKTPKKNGRQGQMVLISSRERQVCHTVEGGQRPNQKGEKLDSKKSKESKQ